MPKSYDAIIIGGGHNGLTNAAYLARAGEKVLVLSRTAVPIGTFVSPFQRDSRANHSSRFLRQARSHCATT
jgi:phytoene dehydrogenase-like protein